MLFALYASFFGVKDEYQKQSTVLGTSKMCTRCEKTHLNSLICAHHTPFVHFSADGVEYGIRFVASIPETWVPTYSIFFTKKIRFPGHGTSTTRKKSGLIIFSQERLIRGAIMKIGMRSS